MLSSPDDTLPRLAYADWLEENSDDAGDLCHAELIRVQCRRDAMARDNQHAKNWEACKASGPCG